MPFKEKDRPRDDDYFFAEDYAGVNECKDAIITLRLRNSRDDSIEPMELNISSVSYTHLTLPTILLV